MMKRILSIVAAFSLLLGCGILNASFAVTANESQQKVELNVGSSRLLVQVYADDIVRVRFAPDGTFRDKSNATFTDKTVKWEPVACTTEDQATEVVITTPKLAVHVEKSTGRVSYFDREGTPIVSENTRTSATLSLDSKSYFSVTQTFNAADTEYLYGLGNVDSVVGNRGTTVAIQQGNTQKRTPMFYSNQGYGILFDVTSNGTLGWGTSNKTYYYRGQATDSMDYYFFYGPDADEVISGYRQVTGTATMLPKNSFGYVQSRNRYASQAELLANVQTFRDKGIPLDNTVIDYYWWNGDFNNITQWNASAWPDVAGMMDKLHEQHVTASISVWPSFKSGTPTYTALSKIAGFLFPTNTNFGYVYDPTSSSNRATYWKMINDNIFSKGMDSIWLDACEPEMGNFANTTGEKTSVGSSRLIGTLYPLLTNQGLYENQRAIAGNEKRVNTLSRGAVAGIQRYGIQSWSGDVASNWAQMTKEVRGALNFASAGLPYFSSDTGGYFGIDTGSESNREMFLRWLQFSTFSSIMRVHGEGCIKEPWSFGAEYEEYIVSCINLRERLVPYIYSLAGAVTQDDSTIVRPLVFDFRTDPNVWKIDNQYMFGKNFMICPVTTEGARARDVYLPAGRWVNFWSGETIDSTGETITAAAPLDEVPVFVRAGSVVPMAMESQYVDEHPDEGEIRVYMGADGSFSLYDDEGNNYNYEKGNFSEIPLSYDEATKTLTIGDRSGSYEGMPETRTFHVVFVQKNYGTGVASSKEYQTTVTYTGKKQTVAFDGNWEIPVPALKLSTLPKPGVAPQPQAPARAMVGEWSFLEGEGAKVKDTSGNFNNGAIVNTSTAKWTTGLSGNALEFSGGSQDVPGTYVDVADTATLDLSDSVSFSAFVNFTGSGHGNIVNKGGNGNKNPGFSLILLDGSRLQLEIQDKDGNKTTAVATGAFPKNAWHHVAFTWQSVKSGGDGIVRLFIDGKQVSSDATASNKFTGPIGQNDYPLRFGCSADNEPAWPNYFKGSMDEIRLYNYTLSAADVKALAEQKTIGIQNPDNITVTPADGKLTVRWADPAVENLKEVLVTVQSEDGSLKKDFHAAPGTETQEVTGLQNGVYYQIALQTVLTDDKTSQGAYLVSGVNAQPGFITCVVTHDKTVYGYVVNYKNEPLAGTLTAQVCDTANNGAEVSSASLTGFTVGALDAQRFQIDIGEFAENQAVNLTYRLDSTGLAAPVTITREKQYIYDASLEMLRGVLKTLLDTPLNEALYTDESVAAYKVLKTKAQTMYDDAKATSEQIRMLVQQMNATLVLKSTYTLGNVDGLDGISTTDARMILQHAAEKITLTGDNAMAADVDQDGKITTTDARLTLQRAADKIDSFPVKK